MSAHNPNFNEDHIPLAYLITFRCYGTWMHGDERGSVDRYHNRYGAPFIPPNERWRHHNEQVLKHPPVELDAERRAAVDAAVRETCEKRNWLLRAINVRTNHAHIVVTAGCKPEAVLSAFKANATRKMREEKRWLHEHSPWSAHGSRRYLWTERHVERAIDYVVNGQGDELPNFDDEEDYRTPVRYGER
jgi:REP element-mobilizing transposase RayT